MDQIISINAIIQNKHGIRVRPSAYFVKIASKYKSDVLIEKNNIKIDGKNILELMTMEVRYGDTIKITAKGEDAQQMLDDLQTLINNKFGFEE
jgi:phosphocarrier protein